LNKKFNSIRLFASAAQYFDMKKIIIFYELMAKNQYIPNLWLSQGDFIKCVGKNPNNIVIESLYCNYIRHTLSYNYFNNIFEQIFEEGFKTGNLNYCVYLFKLIINNDQYSIDYFRRIFEIGYNNITVYGIYNNFMKYCGKYYKNSYLKFFQDLLDDNSKMTNIYNIFRDTHKFVFHTLIIELCKANFTDAIIKLFELPTFMRNLRSYLEYIRLNMFLIFPKTIMEYITYPIQNNNLELTNFLINNMWHVNHSDNILLLKFLYEDIIKLSINYNENFGLNYENEDEDEDGNIGFMHGYTYSLVYIDKDNIFSERIIRWIYNIYELYEPNKIRTELINRYGFSKFLLKKALKSASLETVKWLINIGCDYDNCELLVDAGLYQRIDLIDWIATEKPHIIFNIRSIYYCKYINKALTPEIFKYLLDKYNYVIDDSFWDNIGSFYAASLYDNLRTLYGLPINIDEDDEDD